MYTSTLLSLVAFGLKVLTCLKFFLAAVIRSCVSLPSKVFVMKCPPGFRTFVASSKAREERVKLRTVSSSLIPVVFGDVVFDQKDGFVIHSTERLFSHLARQCHPDRILLVGKEKGVYSDYPANQRLIPDISPQSYESVSNALAASSSTDVTGGMATKVKSMLELVQLEITLLIDIFSGEQDNNLFRVIMGERIGTRLSN